MADFSRQAYLDYLCREHERQGEEQGLQDIAADMVRELRAEYAEAAAERDRYNAPPMQWYLDQLGDA